SSRPGPAQSSARRSRSAVSKIRRASRFSDQTIRPDRERANLAAERGNDLPALLQRVGRRVVYEKVHAPGAARRRGDVVFAVEAKRSSRKAKLVAIPGVVFSRRRC